MKCILQWDRAALPFLLRCRNLGWEQRACFVVRASQQTCWAVSCSSSWTLARGLTGRARAPSPASKACLLILQSSPVLLHSRSGFRHQILLVQLNEGLYHIHGCSCFLLAGGYSGASSPDLPCTMTQGSEKCPPGSKGQFIPSHVLLLRCKHRCYSRRACEPGHDLPGQHLYLYAHFHTLPQQPELWWWGPPCTALLAAF